MTRSQKIQRSTAAFAIAAILACGPSGETEDTAVEAAPPESIAIEIDEGVVVEEQAPPIDDQEEEES